MNAQIRKIFVIVLLMFALLGVTYPHGGLNA